MANINFWNATELTGGGANSLDAINHLDGDGLGTPIGNNDIAIVADAVNSLQRIYEYNNGSGAVESSPDVIQPDSNAGNGRWLLVATFQTMTLTIGYDF